MISMINDQNAHAYIYFHMYVLSRWQVAYIYRIAMQAWFINLCRMLIIVTT